MSDTKVNISTKSTLQPNLSINGDQFNYSDQIVETQGKGVTPYPTLWQKLMKREPSGRPRRRSAVLI